MLQYLHQYCFLDTQYLRDQLSLIMRAIVTYSVMLDTFLCACQAARKLYTNCVELEDDHRTSKVA